MLRAILSRGTSAYLRNTPRHRGRFQLARTAFRLIGERPLRGAYDVTMLTNWRDSTNVLALIGGAFDDVFSIVDTLKPGMAFVDIGANCGVFSMIAGLRTEAHGSVIAFEPSRIVFRHLVANGSLNKLQNFYPFMAAIGPVTKISSFDQADESKTGLGHLSPSGTSSVLQLGSDDLTNILNKLVATRNTMIKIDVEGAELHVLSAIKDLLSRPATETVIVEIDPTLLKRFGHRPSQIYESMRNLNYRATKGENFGSHFNEVFHR